MRQFRRRLTMKRARGIECKRNYSMKKLMLTACLAATVWQGHAQSYDTNNVVVQTFAGSGFTGYLDGQGTQTMFASPSAVIPDSLGNLFVFDIDNSRVRKITPDGAVSTFAGGGNQTTGYRTNVSLPIRGTVTASAAGSSNSIWFVSSTSGIWLYHIDKDGYVS